jgi:hypothetical protein
MLEFRAAAFWIDLVRGLSAISCRWLLRLDFSCRAEANGRFTAGKLKLGIAGPGQLPPVKGSGKQPSD